ncbi:restriction endonuclease subunit S [Thioalkalivibrio sp. ALR17-21]|uniref:restriction endonuclease subunit S n=1 Tax=Thioalkalivibrio sp. ALR17-21 TaxID=1269813 RepID=UPI0009DBE08C|nr:restriction endonuclease subunit S [Thioalkalivibrio sp. ALR17-21]
MAERSGAVEQQAVRDGAAFYSVEPEIATTEDVPPGYKRTEVGVIPEDWRLCELRKLLSAPPNYGINAAATQYEESLPAYLRITDIDNDGRFSPDPPVSVKHKSAHDYFLNTGDLVFARTGASVGKSYEYKSSDGRLVYAGFLIRVSPDTRRLDPTFLSNFCRTEHYWNWVRSVSLRSGQPGVNGAEYGSLLVPVPPVKEQRAIATALSDADTLIESLDRLIAKKRAIKQAAMQKLLTGQTRLPGFAGEWETRRLGNHVSFLKTGTNSRAELASNGRVAYLHYGDIHVRSSVTLNPNAVTTPHIAASKVRHLDKLAPGDLVFVDASEDLEGVGKSVEIIDVPKEGMVAGLHTIAARFDKDVLADGFKAYLQFCPQFIGTLRRLAAGTKVLATNWQHLASVEMELPCVAEQQAIAAVLSDMDAEIETLERRRDKSRQTKQGMMQQLLTGRVRLVKPGKAA